MPADFTNLKQVPCFSCNATGKRPVTKDMLIAAGIYHNYTWEETCPSCYGDGTNIVEVEEE